MGLGAGTRQGGIMRDQMHSLSLPGHQFTSAGERLLSKLCWAWGTCGLEGEWVVGSMTLVPQLFLEQGLMSCAAMGSQGWGTEAGADRSGHPGGSLPAELQV